MNKTETALTAVWFGLLSFKSCWPRILKSLRSPNTAVGRAVQGSCDREKQGHICSRHSELDTGLAVPELVSLPQLVIDVINDFMLSSTKVNIEFHSE